MIRSPMRRAIPLILLALAACSTVPQQPPAPAKPQTAAPPAVHGLTTEEEAHVLALEDRREYDPALTAEWLANPNPLHRARIALSLGRIGPLTFADANSNGERDPGEKQAGVDALSTLVTDPDRNVRMTAAFALGEIGDAAGVEPLLRFAADTDAGVAAEAVEALSKMAGKVTLAQYQRFTTNDQPEGVRSRAIRFLFRFDTDEASAIAAAAIDAQSSQIRQDAAYALFRRAYAPARDRVTLLISDPDTVTRMYAAGALGRIGDKSSVAPLIKALTDPHPWVRTNALTALSRIATKNASALETSDMGDDSRRVIAVTDDPDPGTRASSIDLLGYYAVKNEGARKRLMEIATSGSRWDRELAAGAIAKQFADTDNALVTSLLPNLATWGKVRVLEGSAALQSGRALRQKFAADSEPMVRAATIGNIPDDGVSAEMNIIRPALEDSDVIVRANALDRYAHSTDAKKLDTLQAAERRARTDAMNDARLAALNALADIDFPDRETFLHSLLGDTDPVVRRVAADFIEQKLKKNRPQYTPLAATRPPADYARIVEWSRDPHTATIHMSRGTIDLALLTQDAPITTWNFAQLAVKHYFDKTTFMRVVPTFVIQGGDPRNDMNGGPGYAIRDEINLQKYTRGAVGMALSGPDTGGSQFFITHTATPHLDGGYTVFGRVYGGMSGVADQTERGDLVDTITIDEHKPGDSTASAKTPLPVETGRTTASRLLSIVPEYQSRKESYQPDISEVEFLASAMQPDDRMEVYMGTWCSDSQREVPKLLKIADVLHDKFSHNLPITFVAVDRSKSEPAALIADKHIEKVATFIYYRGDREMGRIVEQPTGLFEDDLLAIVAARQ
jgi:cyclophilin family peptidyl-prolyl cis-trans isomerase/HEAT repeat protein